MKVVEIIKSFRNGAIKHYLVIPDNECDDIDYLVEKWCESDPAGSNYGYEYEWAYVTDVILINKAVEENINKLDYTIVAANKRRAELVDFIKIIS